MTAVDVLAPRGLFFCWQYERFVLYITYGSYIGDQITSRQTFKWRDSLDPFAGLFFKEKNGWRSTSQEFKKADCAKSELESRKVFCGRANKLYLGHFVKPDISLWSQAYPLWTGAHIFTPCFCAACLFRNNDFCTKAVPWIYEIKSCLRRGLVSMCTCLSIPVTAIFMECCTRGRSG